MRGGKTLADRGIIPRLLSNVHRRARKIEKDSHGTKAVEISMSYYEIYNDRVFDLFEPSEKRTAAGLPIRDNNGKTIVAGLSERPCTTLKEFETLYDSGNINRSTSATKVGWMTILRDISGANSNSVERSLIPIPRHLFVEDCADIRRSYRYQHSLRD